MNSKNQPIGWLKMNWGRFELTDNQIKSLVLLPTELPVHKCTTV